MHGGQHYIDAFGTTHEEVNKRDIEKGNLL